MGWELGQIACLHVKQGCMKCCVSRDCTPRPHDRTHQHHPAPRRHQPERLPVPAGRPVQPAVERGAAVPGRPGGGSRRSRHSRGSGRRPGGGGQLPAAAGPAGWPAHVLQPAGRVGADHCCPHVAPGPAHAAAGGRPGVAAPHPHGGGACGRRAGRRGGSSRRGRICHSGVQLQVGWWARRVVESLLGFCKRTCRLAWCMCECCHRPSFPPFPHSHPPAHLHPPTLPQGVCLHHVGGAGRHPARVCALRRAAAQPVCGHHHPRLGRGGPGGGHHRRPNCGLPAPARPQAGRGQDAHCAAGAGRCRSGRL